MEDVFPSVLRKHKKAFLAVVCLVSMGIGVLQLTHVSIRNSRNTVVTGNFLYGVSAHVIIDFLYLYLKIYNICFQAGSYWLTLIDSYGPSGVALLFVVFFEVTGISWGFGGLFKMPKCGQIFCVDKNFNYSYTQQLSSQQENCLPRSGFLTDYLTACNNYN